MAKKISYNEKSHDALVTELVKLREDLNKARLEKRKTGKAKDYRTARKDIARVLTAMNGQTAKNQ